MGLGRLLTRNLKYDVTNTVSGETGTFTIITDGGPGMYPDWSHGEYRGGMGLPGPWRAANLVADVLGQVPWHAYRERSDRPVERLTPTPQLLLQPVAGETRMTTFSSLALDLLWHGNAISVIATRGPDGWPTSTVAVPAEFVQVKRVQQADNEIDWPVGTVVYWIGGRWWPAGEVIHVKGPCKPGALRGMGILENHFSMLSYSQSLAEQASGVAHHAVPSMLIKSMNPDLDKPTADALKAAAIASQRTRQPMVLNPSTDVVPLAWNPTETQLLDARKYSLHEWALIFGVPLHFLGVSDSSRTYSNVEQEGIELVKWSLSGHLARFEQAYSAHLPRGTWAKANLDSVLRADTLSRYQAHALALQHGWLTDDEVRALEDRPPLTPAQRAAMKPPAPSTAPELDETAPGRPGAPGRTEP